MALASLRAPSLALPVARRAVALSQSQAQSQSQSQSQSQGLRRGTLHPRASSGSDARLASTSASAGAGAGTRPAASARAQAPAPQVLQVVEARPGDRFFAQDTRPVVLYDGVCNFCNGAVNFLLDNDRTGKLRLAALQSPAGQVLLERSGRARDDISSILLVEKDRSHVKSEAVLRIGQLLDIPLAALAPLALLAPRVLGDSLYDVVAVNRYNIMGMRDECRVDDGRFADRFIVS